MKTFSTFRPTALMAAMLLIMPAADAADTQQSAASKISAVSNQETGTYDRFIIAYREGSGIRNNPSEVVKDAQFAIAASGVDRMAPRSSRAAVQPLTVTYKRKLGIGSELIQTSRKLDMAEANALMQKIATHPDVLYVEPDRKLRIDEAPLPTFPSMRADGSSTALSIAALRFTPNDPYYNNYQWNFYAPGYSSANINNAWDLASGAGVTVAVIDSGIAPNPDIDHTWVCDGYNFSSDDGPDRDKCGRDPGHPMNSGLPSTWHGTKVSGIVNAKTNNQIGLAGVAYNARLIPIRAVPWDGAYVSDAADAVKWASGGHVDDVEDAKYPAQVINMSFGGMGGPCSATPNEALAKAVQEAIDRNVVLVASAGNNNADNANHIPSSCPGVIAVAATDYFGSRAAEYSNYGAAVALAAPVGIHADKRNCSAARPWECSWLLGNSGLYSPNSDDEPYISAENGTSFAAPLVTGTVALMINARHNAGLSPATPAQIRNWLTSSTRPFPSQPDRPIGSGILDAHAAIVKALDD
ncbi:MAG TPA: S8 family serine peptidase [Dyella sp.]|uniref:S8 family serine peptidase n=1 Tax=Dyella sp. TaxID=1869338 RepID=UPI002BEAC83E|nr:S8 family serine peptidase [Dyella sp.]HUB89599.1 S8 family serine peptidase [Dyella sp.]